MFASTESSLGNVEVHTTSGRGMNPEEITDLAMRRILDVADTAPMPIREQAIAFKDRIRGVLEHYFWHAQNSERTTMLGILERAGYHDAAELIRKL